MKRKAAFGLISLAACAGMALSTGARATEGGGDTIGEGAEAFFAGALPPAGLYALLYYTHYHASRFNDSHGNGSVPGFKLDADVLIPRVVWMSNLSVLGGRYGAYAVLPMQHLALDAGGASFDRTNLGDLIVSPALIAWGSGALRTVAAVEFVFPTGQYDAQSALNTGKNYYTARPVFGVSWLPNDKVEVSAKITYSFNSPNNDTHYHSGNLFHVDYSASYAVTPKARVGLSGYFVKQTTDDMQNGQPVAGDGFRGQAFAIGPGVRYQFSKISVEARIVKEFFVRNRPAGEAVWAKAVIPF
ncbi:phenol degradation protein meta [Burkholderia cepacia]|uniref:Phenol degradation protein meta n=1 Tax=Burkholderia cepacia TaxID=292 RepID=A0AAP4VL56_BURCE|nr:transporter [Burkholderia cepacia]EMD9438560.1 transporter [Burkholderia cepacia]KVX47448.1 phenol degradation protein meta [Burkholderia cepacia]KWD61031.1 phenol degradation protein meta [Burkholderia cepacia]KWD81691.1 phenol degradation protein meta [Burkholderia cepacia]KWH45273.1 phenol degradation protein meta [Burkholderia cepacia]